MIHQNPLQICSIAYSTVCSCIGLVHKCEECSQELWLCRLQGITLKVKIIYFAPC